MVLDEFTHTIQMNSLLDIRISHFEFVNVSGPGNSFAPCADMVTDRQVSHDSPSLAGSIIMDTSTTEKDPVIDVHSSLLSSNNASGEVHRQYLDKEYIIRAREAEVKHHLHSISQLQKKMEKLASELAWELEQHHSKIHELYQLEVPFRKKQGTSSVRIKTNKKTTSRPKNGRTFDIPLVGDSMCETVA